MDFISKYSFVIVSVALSLILVIIVVEQCFQRGKFYKGKLTTSLVNIFIAAICGLFYDKFILKNTVLQWIYIVYLSVLFVAFIAAIVIVANYSSQKANNYSQFISSLNDTSWNVYYLCDRNDRIKEISESLLHDIGLSKKEVIGKRAFDVFDQTIRFTRVNDADITNVQLRDYYRDFSKNSKEGEEFKREIYLQNCNGQTVVLNLIEKPIFIAGKYRGRLNIGQKKSDESLVQVERELVNRNQDLESIQYKFIAALELMQEGIFFNDLDENYIWANDILIKDLGLGSNTIATMDFKQLMDPDDLVYYNAKLKALTPEHPTYDIKYRFKIGQKFEYVHEVGKRIFEDANSNVILGFISRINANHFERTEIAEIDTIKHVDDMLIDLDSLFRDHRIFQLVCINLTTIPEINNRFGRQVGNMVMTEYIKKIKDNFLTESSKIYRASGLVFYFTITDNRKMEMFKRGLTSDSNSMNLTVNYSSIKAELKVHIGIAEALSDAMNREELIKNCNTAINTALNPNYRLNHAYYKDIKDIGIR